ncbi:sarcosine oxidase [Streptomyces sp. V4I8]|uniref:N-methyl-L-tryptophan oxidase n=1 Tax=Streptomyces sp. V4I8 TaxID=3156469 RepID=UPI0035133236
MVIFDTEVVVVGLGALGAHAAWRLAARGIGITGIEQFSPGHSYGSSHGETRLYRVAGLEHAGLTEVARLSYILWQELQRYSTTPLLEITGGVTIGSRHSPLINRTLATSKAHRISIERLNRTELTELFPQHKGLGDDDIGVWDPNAGIIRPKSVILSALEAARSAGADIRTETKVTAINQIPGGARVSLSTGEVVNARQVVLTAGAWTKQFVPRLDLTTLRIPITWFQAADSLDDSFTLPNFPAFNREVGMGRGIWGHGATECAPIKIGARHIVDRISADPDLIDRCVSSRDHEVVTDLIKKALPGISPEPIRASICMITCSFDEQFIVGRLDAESRIVVGGGDSGHAFKHAAGLGELLAQIVTAESTYIDTSFISPARVGAFKPALSS